MKNNNETIGVKLSYDGEMRRFPLVKGTSFNELSERVATLLELPKGSDIIIKYTDDEGDLITISSDVELNSAIVDGQLLRITVTSKHPVPNAVNEVPAAVNVAPTAAFVPPPRFPHIGGGPGRFGFGRGAWHIAKEDKRNFSPEDIAKWKEAKKQAREEWKQMKEEKRKNLTPEEKAKWKEAKKQAREEWIKMKEERKNLTPEEKAKWKEAKKQAREEWIKMREERKQQGLAAGGSVGRGWGRGGRWARGPHHHEGAQQEAGSERLVARFVKDVTIEDGTEIAPGAAFVKTWRIRNEGGAWPAGCGLMLLNKHGDDLSSPSFIAVPFEAPVAPNQEFEISVNLVAPTKPGRYTGYWKMATAEGRKFGQRFWVSITVPSSTSSSSSEGEKEADKYEALVDVVLAKGVNARRHRVFRLLQKFNGDVEKVTQHLNEKATRRAGCKKH